MTFSYIPQLICLLTGLIEIHSEIMTVSEVSVQAGRSISIPCLYDPRYTNHVKYLCKGRTWNFCKLVVTTDQESSGKYSISDDKYRRIFTVTINDLTSGDTDLWWCVVEIGGLDIIDESAYFHLSVTETTTTTAETLPTTPQHSSLLTSAETHTAQPTNPTINGTGGDSLQAEHKISTRTMILITSLTLSLIVLLLVPAAFFGWRMMRRRHATPEGAHIPADSQTGSDPGVHYATVVHNQHIAGQNKIEPAEGSVIYSTLQIKMQ
ncbi:hypothetical protein D5F01_LYC21260 [Larimichthys crocea]|uniref:Immunoglobulin domain-containing protein n=1 Tax=Larimichthys crocea TaxID=215358 RepID=A0A6G0HNP8_LARCR|nr:hypothetical protein D5F01_LYC21260 [Larimichthys crocea]